MGHPVKVLQRVFAGAVADIGAVEHAASGRARAELVERLLARGDHVRIEGHAHVIVSAEQNRSPAVADRHGRALDTLHHEVERIGLAGFEQGFAQLDNRVELGEEVAHLVFKRSSASTSWPTVSISACRFIEISTSNSSSTLATKSSTVRLSHSRSWAKRVASVITTLFLLKGAIISTVLA